MAKKKQIENTELESQEIEEAKSSEKSVFIFISDPSTFSAQAERGLDLDVEKSTGLVKPSQLLENEKFKEVNGKTYIEFRDKNNNVGLR